MFIRIEIIPEKRMCVLDCAFIILFKKSQQVLNKAFSNGVLSADIHMRFNQTALLIFLPASARARVISSDTHVMIIKYPVNFRETWLEISTCKTTFFAAGLNSDFCPSCLSTYYGIIRHEKEIPERDKSVFKRPRTPRSANKYVCFILNSS